MPARTNFATASYTAVNGMQTGTPEMPQQVQPTARPTTSFTTPSAEPAKPTEPTPAAAADPTPDIGHVTEDDFDLIMGILNRSKKK
jgi:hypothetical protein